MSGNSTIEWTEKVWNPVRGCSRVSPGCEYCYPERLARRFSKKGLPFEGLTKKTSKGPRWSGKIKLVTNDLKKPLSWKKPQYIFVNSMSDLFHEKVPLEYILEVFSVMRQAHWHVFQVLTKRSERLLELSPKIDWPPNVWMGVSVENEKHTFRIDNLRKSNAKIKFLSVEPLLGKINHIKLKGIDWVIVGGESGIGARPMETEWVRKVRDQCVSDKVPFFFKQWGGVNKKKTGRTLDGAVWDEMPSK